MIEPIQKASEEFQKLSKNNFDAAVRSYTEFNTGFQAAAIRWTDFSKRSIEDAMRTFQEILAAKSLERAMEIQSQYAKKAYDDWMAEASNIGDLYVAATRDAYKPVGQVIESAPKPAPVSESAPVS